MPVSARRESAIAQGYSDAAINFAQLFLAAVSRKTPAPFPL